MSFFSFTSRNEEISLIFDIGSGTLGCAIVKFNKGKSPQILYTYREPIVSKRNIDSEGLTQAMIKTLNSVCDVVLRDGFAHLPNPKNSIKRINKVHYVFSSPWVLSQTKVITVEKETEVLVTRELIESIIKDEEKGFERMYSEGNYSDTFDFDVDIIERNVVQVNLNGYTTHNPFGKYAHKIEVPFFLSVISRKVVGKIDDVVRKHFSPHGHKAHSCILLSCITLRDMFHAEDDFMFVDIHGELTDIGIVKNGVLVQAASFPLGINTIVRKVSKELSTTPQVAESQIRIFLEGKTDDKISVIMKGVLNKIRREWVALFHEALDDLNAHGVIPHKIFLIVGSGMERFFADFIQEEKFSLGMVQDTFEVTPLDGEIFTQYGSYTKRADRDPFLGMHAIALNKFDSSHTKEVL